MINIKKLPLSYKIIILIFILDIFFVALHFVFKEKAFSFLFHLDYENNLPTFYQGIKLILVACLLFTQVVIDFLKKDKKKKINLILIPWMVFFMFLVLEEVGQIHENSEKVFSLLFSDKAISYLGFFNKLGYQSTPWLVFYLPFFLIISAYLLFLIRYFYQKHSKNIPIFFLGLLSFAIVILLEVVGTHASYFYQAPFYDILIVFEEYLEMLGVTFFIVFHLMSLRKNISQGINK